MYVVASFKLNKNLERAFIELEHYGIENEHILALPLESRVDDPNQYDSYKKNKLESAPIFGTILMLFGSIYGFVLEWGPIIWGLIGFAVGILLGLSLDAFRIRQKKKRMVKDATLTEIILLIHCKQEQSKKVKDILWKWFPVGVATFEANQERDISI
jgi:hypothetical protein